jgi:crossover junction endodeoxyribonuclease RusA
MCGESGTLRVFVPGGPITEGSTRAFARGGRAVVLHDNPLLDGWRSSITLLTVRAATAAGWVLPLDEPVMVGAVFWLPRPKRPRWDVPAVKPDLDKLQRSLGDGLCPRRGGGVLREDSRIVKWLDPEKRYAPPGHRVGVDITIVRQATSW